MSEPRPNGAQSAPDPVWSFAPLYDPNAPLKPVDWLVHEYLEKGTVGAFYGPSGTLKSFIALHLSLCIATGRPFCGQKVLRGTVVYIAAEGERGLQRRIKAWEKRNGYRLTNDDNKRLVTLYAPENVSTSPDLLNGYTKKLGKAIAAHPEPVVMVVFDTLAKSLGGAEETNQAFSFAISNLETYVCKPHGVTALLIHHTGKDASKGMRGGSAIGGGVDFAYSMAAINPDGGERTATDGVADFQWKIDRIRMRCRKQKDEEKIEDLWFRASREVLGIDPSTRKEISSLVVEKAMAVEKKEKVNSEGRTADEAKEMLVMKLAAEGNSKTAIAAQLRGRKTAKLAFIDTVLNKGTNEMVPDLVPEGGSGNQVPEAYMGTS